MAKTTCRLCFRRFASPRALAGHMRSHSLAAAAAKAAAAASAAAAAEAAAAMRQISSASSGSISFTTDDEEKSGSISTLRGNPQLRLSADGSFSDSENEAESTPTRASPRAAWGEVDLMEPATPEEGVALSLMKLSRASWPAGMRLEVDYSDDGSDDDGYAPPAPPRPSPVVEKRTQFECTACKKVFRSYQALGGHRASNVRGGRGGCLAPPPPPQPQPLLPLQEQHGDEDLDAKHECPYCFRVFSSGQALGGHKRSHACGAAAAAAQAASASTSAAAPPSQVNNPGTIDLNVEPSSEEVDTSPVSDTRFNPGS